MKLVEVNDIEEFDSFVKTHKNANIMQSSSWAQVKKNDWQPHYLMFKEDDVIIATALILERKALLNKSFFYVPRGFIMDYSDNHLKDILKLTKKYVQEHNGFVLRFDPELPLKIMDSRTLEVLDDNSKLYHKIASLTKVRPLSLDMADSSQPRFQMVVDLQDELLDKIKSKKRRLVKDSYLTKRGFAIVEDTSENGVKEFARLSRLTEERQKVALRNEDYFMNMYHAFKDNNEIKIFFAEVNLATLIENTTNGEELAFLKAYQSREGNIVRTNAIMCIYGTEMVQMFYGASDSDFLRYKAGYALHFKAMEDAKKLGYRYFNLGGVEGSLDDGLAKFKSEFHPLVYEYMGDFDLVINPVIYLAFNHGVKLFKKIRR